MSEGGGRTTMNRKGERVSGSADERGPVKLSEGPSRNMIKLEFNSMRSEFLDRTVDTVDEWS